MKTILRIIFVLIAIAILSTIFFVPLHKDETEPAQIKIVTTLFPAYDIARAVSNETNATSKLLIKPGVDLHSYEPSPQDIIDIKESDIFIYNGGESEDWVQKILPEIDTNNTTIVRMMDAVELKAESTTNILEDDDEHDHDNKDDYHNHNDDHDHKDEESESAPEYDEHIWTSPKNVKKIAQAIAQAVKNQAPQSTSVIQRNLNNYNQQLDELDQSFTELANTKTGTLIVADRFPFRYFVDDYSFSYLAAFPGCSEQTEASAKTIAKLSKKVKENSKKIIFHLELSNTKITQTIASSTKAKVLLWHSVHNVSQKDFDSGRTYIDIMRDNLKNLNEALDERPESQ